MGLYNRNFAKQRVAGLDRELGKDGELLDLAKVKKWLMHGKKESSCSRSRQSSRNMILPSDVIHEENKTDTHNARKEIRSYLG